MAAWPQHPCLLWASSHHAQTWLWGGREPPSVWNVLQTPLPAVGSLSAARPMASPGGPDPTEVCRLPGQCRKVLCAGGFTPQAVLRARVLPASSSSGPQVPRGSRPPRLSLCLCLLCPWSQLVGCSLAGALSAACTRVRRRPYPSGRGGLSAFCPSGSPGAPSACTFPLNEGTPAVRPSPRQGRGAP